MHALQEIAPAFVKMAHTIVWCAAATVDSKNRPWSRILHPVWDWDGDVLKGAIAVSPTTLRRSHLAHSPYMSCAYLAPDHDTAIAECSARWCFDEETRVAVWNRFKNAPAPVGYDPAIVAGWDHPMSDTFAVLELRPWRLRVQPGVYMLTAGRKGEIMTWQSRS